MAEPEQTHQPPEPSVAASQSSAPASSLVDQYDAESETPSTSAAPEAPSSVAPTPPTRPRDPVTGRFLPPEPQERKHSQYMIGMAQDLGISPEEIGTMQAGELEVAVYHLSKRARAQQREGSIERTIHEATDRNLGQQAEGGSPAGSATSSASGTKPEAASPPVDEPYDLGINEAEYDPALIGAIKRMAADYAKQIKALKQQIGQLQHVEQIRAHESFAQKMDRLFAGDSATFGEGAGRQLGEESAELARRRAVLGVMQTIKAPTIEEKYEKAYQMLYGTRQAQPAQPADELEARRAEWQRSNVARPTQRNGAAEPPGTEKAVRSVRAKMAEMDGAADSGEADAGDFLG